MIKKIISHILLTDFFHNRSLGSRVRVGVYEIYSKRQQWKNKKINIVLCEHKEVIKVMLGAVGGI